MSKEKERKRYTVVTVNGKSLKTIFTGYFMECISAANYLIDKYNWPKGKIVFMDNDTNEIADIKFLAARWKELDLGHFSCKD